MLFLSTGYKCWDIFDISCRYLASKYRIYVLIIWQKTTMHEIFIFHDLSWYSKFGFWKFHYLQEKRFYSFRYDCLVDLSQLLRNFNFIPTFINPSASFLCLILAFYINNHSQVWVFKINSPKNIHFRLEFTIL